MKKFQSLFAALSLAAMLIAAPALSFARAEIHVGGVVESISPEKSTFTMKAQSGTSMTFFVNAESDFEVVVTSTGNDYDVLFGDLKVGDKVHVEANAGQNDPIADDVKIMR